MIKLNTKSLGATFRKTDHEYNIYFILFYFVLLYILCLWDCMTALGLASRSDSMTFLSCFRHLLIIRWGILHLVGKVISLKSNQHGLHLNQWYSKFPLYFFYGRRAKKSIVISLYLPLQFLWFIKSELNNLFSILRRSLLSPPV